MFQKAVQQLMSDGTYKKIIDTWKLQAGRDHDVQDQRRQRLRPAMSRDGRPAGGRGPQRAAAEELTVVPVRHPLRWVAVVVLGVLAAMFIHSLVVNPAWQWSYVQGYFADAQIVDGIWVTLS